MPELKDVFGVNVSYVVSIFFRCLKVRGTTIITAVVVVDTTSVVIAVIIVSIFTSGQHDSHSTEVVTPTTCNEGPFFCNHIRYS